MKNNFCANCGTQLNGKANFCPSCGSEAEFQNGAHTKAYEGEVLSNHSHTTSSEPKEVPMVAQVIIYGLLGLFGLYLAFLSTLLLIIIFKFSVLAGLLLFFIGGVGVGLLYAPTWLAMGGAFGLIALLTQIRSSALRFLSGVLGVAAVAGMSYLVMMLVAFLVGAIVS